MYHHTHLVLIFVWFCFVFVGFCLFFVFCFALSVCLKTSCLCSTGWPQTHLASTLFFLVLVLLTPPPPPHPGSDLNFLKLGLVVIKSPLYASFPVLKRWRGNWEVIYFFSNDVYLVVTAWKGREKMRLYVIQWEHSSPPSIQTHILLLTTRFLLVSNLSDYTMGTLITLNSKSLTWTFLTKSHSRNKITPTLYHQSIHGQNYAFILFTGLVRQTDSLTSALPMFSDINSFVD